MAEGSTSASAVFRARPTLRFNGVEDAQAPGLLLAMKFEESEGGMSALELRFTNWATTPDGGAGFAFGAASPLQLGGPVEVYVGDETQPRALFKGKVSALEGNFPVGAPPELVVLAEDALQKARLERRSRTHREVSPGDVARTIAGDLGLDPVITGLAAPVGTWVQYNESDLAFLRRLLFRFDADVQIVEDQLQVSPRGEVQRGLVELALGSQLVSARVCADLADQATKISARGWNAVSGSAAYGEATACAHAGPGAGRLGADLLRDAFGERSEHFGQFAGNDDAEMAALAQAAFDGRARRFVRVDASADGNAQLRVGSHAKLTGLGPQFSNTYYLVQTRHHYDQRLGYRTEFRGECAFLGT